MFETLYKLSWSITAMRRAGLSDWLIAQVIADIRTATQNEERARLESLVRNSPPQYNLSHEIKAELDKLKVTHR